MKVTFEFDTDKEDFDYAELYAVQDAQKLAYTLSKVLDLARHYEKFEEREAIPVGELIDEIRNTVCEEINMERYGY